MDVGDGKISDNAAFGPGSLMAIKNRKGNEGRGRGHIYGLGLTVHLAVFAPRVSTQSEN